MSEVLGLFSGMPHPKKTKSEKDSGDLQTDQFTDRTNPTPISGKKMHHLKM
jgi:hypothetical protein